MCTAITTITIAAVAAQYTALAEHERLETCVRHELLHNKLLQRESSSSLPVCIRKDKGVTFLRNCLNQHPRVALALLACVP
jgi:hypothetical protein